MLKYTNESIYFLWLYTPNVLYFLLLGTFVCTDIRYVCKILPSFFAEAHKAGPSSCEVKVLVIVITQFTACL